MSRPSALTAGILSAALLLAVGCANDTGSDGGTGDGGGDKGDITLSGQNFTETQITAAMYSLLLEDAGYAVTTKLVDTRDVYIPEMEKGDVDIATEYVSGLADFLNTTTNGDDAEPVSSSDLDETMQQLDELAAKSNITMLEPAEAVDANAFAVTSQFAEDNNLSTLSDLAALGEPIVLAAAPDCEGRTDCEGGLSDDYGIDITKVLPLGYASPQAIESVVSGESQLVEVASTQSESLAEQDLVVLEDDKQIQPVQNLIPAVNSDFLEDNPDVEETLNALAEVLTSEDIAGLDAEVDIDRADPADVAQEYLEGEGLL
ncbi:MAG: ABC transporter substrate-binding protein [Nocardioidaceae bacterium]|jgi:osmoprotectant transport system substrate-binding protein